MFVYLTKRDDRSNGRIVLLIVIYFHTQTNFNPQNITSFHFSCGIIFVVSVWGQNPFFSAADILSYGHLMSYFRHIISQNPQIV